MNRQLNTLATIAISLIVAFVCLVGISPPSSAQSVGLTNPVPTPQYDGYESQPYVVPDLNSKPLPSPITPITGTPQLIISDQFFLTGYPWEASEVQRFLEEQNSVLSVAFMDPYGDGVTMPASEAIASISGYLTVSPPVLLSLGEMNYGLLSRKLANSAPLTEEEQASLSVWFYEQASELSAQFYAIDNLGNQNYGEPSGIDLHANETALLESGFNAASLTIYKQLESSSAATDPSTESAHPQIPSFIDTYTRYFGSPLGGNLRAPNGDSDTSDARSSSSSVLPVLYFPWTGRDTWNFTGGPHGTNWAALDFQPTGWGGLDCKPMHVSDRWITSAAGGKVIANTGFQVLIDHDYDGNKETGWQTKYFHVYNIQVALNQTVNKNVKLGNPSCYGGVANGVHVHFETLYQGKAQPIHGKSVGGWRAENGAVAYGGALRKGNLVRQPGTSNKMLLISNNCSVNYFYGEFFNEPTLNHSIYPPQMTVCTNVVSYEWGGQSPGSSVGADNYSVRWEGVFTNFNGGDYTFVARADDGVRVYLDNSTLIDRWFDQSPTAQFIRLTPSAGAHNVKVEYYERGGGAAIRVGWCPGNQYIVDFYNNKTLSGRPAVVGCHSGINNNWGNSSPHSAINPDNFSGRWMGYFRFAGDIHHFFAKADDGIRVFVDNSQIIYGWRDQGPTEYRASRSMTSGLHGVMVEYYESGGGALASTYWSPNMARNRTSIATSTQSSTSYPARYGNDGNNSTRWSSSVVSTLLKEQWWIVDLGSRRTFSQIRINWEQAYAKEYWVVWKDDSVGCNSGTYSGYRLSGNKAGWTTVNIGARTARCVAVVMTVRGPYNNYSFWEAEVFQPTFSARSKQGVLFSDSSLMYPTEAINDGSDVQMQERLVEFLPVTVTPLLTTDLTTLGEPVQFELNREDLTPGSTD